jgi:hypothetical protein
MDRISGSSNLMKENRLYFAAYQQRDHLMLLFREMSMVMWRRVPTENGYAIQCVSGAYLAGISPHL